ncbi:MAG: phosphate ABC transporter permease PstA [Bacteroidales bacterium]|nr:phosphate ABC transporter permease PstA [Bacteroidales bacterium]
MNLNKVSYRLLINKCLLGIVVFVTLLTAVPLFAILGEVFIRGIGEFSWSFLTEPTPTAFKAMKAVANGEAIPGGIANGIIGTLLMLCVSTVVAVPVGIACGVFLAENAKNKFAVVVSYLTDLLQGTPSVIIGIIVYSWVVIPMNGYSAMAGSVALFIMMLPLIIRSTEETVKMLPTSLKEAGLALGGSYAQVVVRILLPSAFSGIFTGVLLAISRVAGETAPLTFTALGCSMIRWNIDKPISSVSLLIWEFFNDPNLQDLVWGASLFLLIFVLLLNLIAKKIKKWNS